MNIIQSRRSFIQKSLITGVGLAIVDPFSVQAMMKKSKMKFGLVTYQWGKDWDLPTLIANCEKTGLLGVELRTEHAHKVETNLTPAQRADVKKRFADSKVTCIGYGSNFEYHSPDPAVLRNNIEQTKEYIKLYSD
jgi:sugar phosphate isomerase/epimerase